MSDDLRLQIKIARIQIISIFFIAIGGVVFGLGAAMWYVSKVMMLTETYSTFDSVSLIYLHQSGFTFLVLGVISLGIGILVSIIMLNYVGKTRNNIKNNNFNFKL